MRKYEADLEFSRFLRQVREEEHIRQEQLSEGLMTASQLARVEKGQRSVSKNMRDRLLGRLGISSDLYENLLNIEDYEAWEWQRSILCAVEQKDYDRAKRLLAAYEKQESKVLEGRIKQQFCLVMQAELLRQLGAKPHEIGCCYEKAVKLTVPTADYLCISESLLSIQEINMVLEYAYFKRQELGFLSEGKSASDFLEKCKELMACVENSAYDDLSKVKIYPKIAYYYLREAALDQCEWSQEKLGGWLAICDCAIEMLQNTGRAYYLLELLEMKVKFVKTQGLAESEGKLRESIEFIEVLKSLYAEYEVPAYMQDCTYLYQQRWVFYIGDVLRIRRNMFDLTQEELCGNDCSVRTLRRTEKRIANMQHESLGILLRKLGLSKEFQKARLASHNREGLKLMEEIAVCRNNRQLERAKEILEQMKEKAECEFPENQQYFMEAEASLNWMMGKMTKEEFAAAEEEALGCTLKVKDLYHMDEVYLTEMEMLCIRQRVPMLPDEDRRKCIDFLIRFFEKCKKNGALSECISMYEFAAIGVVCELGNLKEYQRSIDLAKKAVQEDLRCRRIWGIEGYLYEILWNQKEKMTGGLRKCIILSHFCKKKFYEDFYVEKMCQSLRSFSGGRSLHGAIPPSSV